MAKHDNKATTIARTKNPEEKVAQTTKSRGNSQETNKRMFKTIRKIMEKMKKWQVRNRLKTRVPSLQRKERSLNQSPRTHERAMMIISQRIRTKRSQQAISSSQPKPLAFVLATLPTLTYRSVPSTKSVKLANCKSHSTSAFQ